MGKVPEYQKRAAANYLSKKENCTIRFEIGTRARIEKTGYTSVNKFVCDSVDIILKLYESGKLHDISDLMQLGNKDIQNDTKTPKKGKIEVVDNTSDFIMELERERQQKRASLGLDRN